MMNMRELKVSDCIGKDFGSTTILKEIGRGAMGVVFLGFQKTLKRRVAVKVLPKAQQSSHDTAGLFRDEAETVAVLAHPNIVPIYDMGETDDFYFLVMQYVEGENLRTIIRRRLNHPLPSKRVLPAGETLDIADAMLDALGYAHDEGIVHQDVKPANIILDARQQRPFLTDFGVARVLAAEYRPEGSVVGSALYMSPEQSLGLDTDGRSDIYSLGVILFEMAVGRLPLAPESPDQVLWCKQNDPAHFFTKTPGQVAPQLDKRLEEIIMKATAADRDARYADCRSFRTDLNECLSSP
jgi:serine/threonine-protein kinase